MLQNEYLVANFGFGTAKNEPRQLLQFLAGKLDFNTVAYDRIRQLRLGAGESAAAAFTGEQHLVRTTVRCRGTFRDAQHELMDGGAAIELAGDALLADGNSSRSNASKLQVNSYTLHVTRCNASSAA